MNYTSKIKTLQRKAGLTVDGVAGVKTWVGIYSLVFASQPHQTSVKAIIKAIQQKLNIRPTGQAGFKTWDGLHQLLIAEDKKSIGRTMFIDSYNEEVLDLMPLELIPFAKELINICSENGIYIRLTNRSTVVHVHQNEVNSTIVRQDFEQGDINLNYHNFGLAFGVGIYESNALGELKYRDHPILYDKVAKLGESIGLTWGGNKMFTRLRYFELRPAWAVRMRENDMINELYRRKEANINLLAIL
ncbi:M15 family metallopeptidase [Pedobacter sp. ASV28]|jgi:peptidoglycan LD-endopeptidase CwlK|uniref:M15 family metallopeptidase n=1 Tax=Pedobacter sp. ASV28 TaxID=2795123 RepID=UPI0018EC1E3B|nr:M15 family metallopeptidase [Pedobacter sp. ASV28]